jgi:hypothetical protein
MLDNALSDPRSSSCRRIIDVKPDKGLTSWLSFRARETWGFSACCLVNGSIMLWNANAPQSKLALTLEVDRLHRLPQGTVAQDKNGDDCPKRSLNIVMTLTRNAGYSPEMVKMWLDQRSGYVDYWSSERVRLMSQDPANERTRVPPRL